MTGSVFEEREAWTVVSRQSIKYFKDRASANGRRGALRSGLADSPGGPFRLVKTMVF